MTDGLTIGSLFSGIGGLELGLEAGRLASLRGDWWTSEPGLGCLADGLSAGLDVARVAHDVPDRAARLRALGNAVVPAVAFEIGLILRELMG